MYIGLILLSPILNLALNSMQTPRQIWLLTGSVVLVTILPTVTSVGLLPDWWVGLYPLYDGSYNGLLQGNFGYSYEARDEVINVVGPRMKNTIFINISVLYS